MTKDPPDLKGLKIDHRQLSELTGYNEKRFRQLAQEGYFPIPVRGEYELIPTLAGLFRNYREQIAKKRPGSEAKKEDKLGLEVQRLAREEKEAEGKLLTLDEWKTLTAETIPPIVRIFSVLFATEIPAFCSGQAEGVIRAWCKKRDAQVRKVLRTTEEAFEPVSVVKRRPYKTK